MEINILLFADFETLDAFGPVEVFGRMEEFHLRYISAGGGIVKSSQGVPIQTEPWQNADPSAILLVPGGQGTRTLVGDKAFLEMLEQLAVQSQYCLTVCTGSALLAKTDLLDGRRATSNKRSFSWVKSQNPKVEWLARARWAVDGKFYTSSGISAGIDMALGFVADLFGREKAEEIAKRIEYVWNQDKEHDLFAQ